MQYLSTKKAIQWLRENAQIGSDNLVVDRKFMHRLDETCRLLPDKHGLFGKKYSLASLKQYAHDVKPR